MLGTSSHSTNGAKEWFCYLHVAYPSEKWQNITFELKRLVWLVEILRSIRLYRGTEHWPEMYVSYKPKIILNQRSDLVKNQSESLDAWISRLEHVLSNACTESFKSQLPLES
jgi:hypothetical protein